MLSEVEQVISDGKAAAFLATLESGELAYLEDGNPFRDPPGRVQTEISRISNFPRRVLYTRTLRRNQPREKARREQARRQEEDRIAAHRRAQDEADRRRQEESEKGRREQEAKLAEERGRPLRVVIDSAGKERYRVLFRSLVHERNGSRRDVQAAVVQGQLVLEFDGAGVGWPKFTIYQWWDSVLEQRPVLAPLLVRLFDKNGQYLTHFVTREVFTPSKDGYRHWKKQLAEVLESPEGRLLLLQPAQNRFVYHVNQRDLSFARSMAIGFDDMDNALGFSREGAPRRPQLGRIRCSHHLRLQFPGEAIAHASHTRLLLLGSAWPAQQPDQGPELEALAVKLRSQKAAERAEAAEALGRLGKGARPLARALCQAMLDNSPQVRENASAARKQVDPQLHPHLETIPRKGTDTAVHPDILDRFNARKAIAELGPAGKATTPVMCRYLPAHLIAVERVRRTRTGVPLGGDRGGDGPHRHANTGQDLHRTSRRPSGSLVTPGPRPPGARSPGRPWRPWAKLAPSTPTRGNKSCRSSAAHSARVTRPPAPPSMR